MAEPALWVSSDGTLTIPRSLNAEHRDRTARLDEHTRDLLPAFEGNETERNWAVRETNITVLRRITAGNAPADWSVQYRTMMRTMLDGILKGVNSLRTSLSTNGCHLVQEMTVRLGSDVDPMLDLITPHFLKLCGNTKTINATNGNAAISAIMTHATHLTRLMALVWTAVQEKNVRPRGYAVGWLSLILDRYADHRQTLEHGSCMDHIEKTLIRGLADADPGVRERTRGAYWTFNRLFPTRAENIMSTLKPAQQTQLLKHGSNPTGAPTSASTSSSSSRPAITSRSTTNPTRPSVRDAMNAARRAKNATSRPGSALSNASMPDPPIVIHAAPHPTHSHSSKTSAAGTDTRRPFSASNRSNDSLRSVEASKGHDKENQVHAAGKHEDSRTHAHTTSSSHNQMNHLSTAPKRPRMPVDSSRSKPASVPVHSSASATSTPGPRRAPMTAPSDTKQHSSELHAMDAPRNAVSDDAKATSDVFDLSRPIADIPLPPSRNASQSVVAPSDNNTTASPPLLSEVRHENVPIRRREHKDLISSRTPEKVDAAACKKLLQNINSMDEAKLLNVTKNIIFELGRAAEGATSGSTSGEPRSITPPSSQASNIHKQIQVLLKLSEANRPVFHKIREPALFTTANLAAAANAISLPSRTLELVHACFGVSFDESSPLVVQDLVTSWTSPAKLASVTANASAIDVLTHTVRQGLPASKSAVPVKSRARDEKVGTLDNRTGLAESEKENGPFWEREERRTTIEGILRAFRVGVTQVETAAKKAATELGVALFLALPQSQDQFWAALDGVPEEDRALVFYYVGKAQARQASQV